MSYEEHKSKVTLTIVFEKNKKHPCFTTFGRTLKSFYNDYIRDMNECLDLSDCKTRTTGSPICYEKEDKDYPFGQTGKVYHVDHFGLMFDGDKGSLSIIFSGKHCVLIADSVISDFMSYAEFGYVTVISTVVVELLDD